MQSLMARLRALIQTHGWRSAMHRLGASLRWRLHPTNIRMHAVRRENDAFDRRHGTDTRGEIPLEQVGIDAGEAALGNGVYRAITTSHFRKALGLLERDHDPDWGRYTFLDFGSGKGKALLLAAERPFRRIIGIEYSAPLHHVALANIGRRRNAGLPCAHVESLHADARSCELPGDPLVCFFFNPFHPSVWHDVLQRLRASFDQAPRPMHLVYVNVRNVDELGDVFSRHPVFVPRSRTRTCLILSATPAVAPGDAG